MVGQLLAGVKNRLVAIRHTYHSPGLYGWVIPSFLAKSALFGLIARMEIKRSAVYFL